MRYLGTVVVLILLALVPSRAWAHDPALSGIRVLLRANDVVITVSTHVARLRAAAGVTGGMTNADIDRAIGARLRVRLDGADVAPLPGHVINDASNDLLTWQMIRPGDAQTVDVLSRLYADDASSRTVVTIMRDGQASDDVLLDAQHPDYITTRPADSFGALAGRYVRMGITHILSGPDHVLFVLGLLLLGQSLGAVLRTITAFTLAHSLTLGIAALGLFVPSSRIVEPLIALSIVAVAVENLRGRPTSRQRDYRPLVAFAFGLVHGFGFAGALTDAGLTGRALWIALGAFNIGVEVGQSLIVIAAVPVITWCARRYLPQWRRVVVVGSLAIAAIGGYWFVARALPVSSAIEVRNVR